MYLVVTGSRTYKNRNTISDALSAAHSDTKLGGIELLFSGHCPRGADNICEQWAIDLGIQCVLLPAPWRSAAGYRSGHVRNLLMLNLALSLAQARMKKLRLAAFPSACIKPDCPKKQPHWSHGTDDCWEKATQLGIKSKFFADETLI